MILDLASVAVTLGALGTGWLLGRHARLRRTPNQPGQPQPICLCGHHYGTHDSATGGCGAQSKERFQGRPGGDYCDVWIPCACVRYTGPQPVEQYWVPPAADMTIVTAPRPVEAANPNHEGA